MTRSVSVRLLADVADFTRNIGGNATSAVKTLSGELDKTAKSGHLDRVADSATGLGLGLVGVAGLAIKSAADFEKAMSGVRAATHASASDMSLLSDAALQAGKDTSFSATEAADGITELSKAGVSTADVLSGGLAGALDLAAAGQLDVGEAAETAASAMTQFKLSGKEVPHIADLLAAGAGKAQGSVHDMGAALNQAGLVSAQMGNSIEETTGTLAAFASAGMTGSDSGTSLKTAMLMLANPTEKASGLMEELGINAYDATGKFVGMAGLAGQLKTQLGGLTQEQRNAALATIFGSDAIRAASVLYEQGAEGITSWTNKVNDSGYAAETAKIQTDNLAGDLERLKGSLETMAIEAGGGATGGLRTLTQGLDALVGEFGELPPAVGSSLTVIAGIGGTAALALAGFIKMRSGVTSAIEQLSAMGPAGEKAAGALGKTAKAAGIAAAAFVALEIVGAVADKLGNAAVNVDKLTGSLENYAKTGKLTEGVTDTFGENLDEFAQIAQSADASTHGFWGSLNDLTSSIPGVGSVVDSLNEKLYGTSFNDAAASMAALDQSFTTFIGTQKDASRAGEIWNELVRKSGLNTQDLAKLLPGAWKGLQDLQAKAHGSAGAVDALATGASGAADGLNDVAGAAGPAAKEAEKYATAADASAAAVKGQRDALSQLYNFMKAETDPIFGLLDAQQNLTKAQKAASKAIKDHGRDSAEAKDATRALAKAAIELQGQAGQLGDTFNGKLDPAMRATLRSAGLTKTQIADVEKQFGAAKKAADRYAGNYKANASAPGADNATKQLENAYKKAVDFDGTYQAYMKTPGGKDAEKQIRDAWILLQKYDGGWTAAIKTTGYSKVAGDLRHLLAAQRALSEGTSVNEANRELGHFFAAGGPVYGPGTATSDSITARLSAGEHVWTAAEVAALGGQSAMLQLRAAVKSGKRVEVGDESPGFAAGGAITLPFPTTAAKTKIPKDTWSMPSGSATDDWIVRTVNARFPGMNYISKFRPGAMTLTGNRSLHSMHRAVDWPASHELAQYWHDTFMSKTKELITPWNDLNIHNGRPHRYTGAVWNQHNFPGGNAHDHIAMADGGHIKEPVFGYGMRSGNTYSFGERGIETVIPGAHGIGGGATTLVGQFTFTGPVGSRVELENWLSASFDNLRRKGKV